MFKRLLVPTDGSELSLRAARIAIDLALSYDAELHAFHVVPSYSTMPYITELLAVSEMQYCAEAKARADRYLDEIRLLAEQAGVTCSSSQVIDDSPHKAIAAAVKEHGCDLVVMASHGWRGLNRLLLGSETHKLLLETDVPVLVCR